MRFDQFFYEPGMWIYKKHRNNEHRGNDDVENNDDDKDNPLNRELKFHH